MVKGEVAILGSGILGSSIALFLAQRNIKVKLFDAESTPFSRASRWNEGKIHLGYLYSADPTMKTAKKLIPGGLHFPRLIKDILGFEIPQEIVTQKDDYYLIHKNSVVDATHYQQYARHLSTLIREHPYSKEYFIPLDIHHPRRLEADELCSHFNPEFITAAFKVPERSIRTTVLADYFEATLKSNPGVELMMNYTITSVRPEIKNQGWRIHSTDSGGNEVVHKRFKVVINALWEGRAQIDQTMGASISDRITHRYRVSVFARTKRPVDFNSAVIAVGPFGDVKNYDDQHLYLSWYDIGLLAQGHDTRPPEVTQPDPGRQAIITRETLQKLALHIPELACLEDNIETSEVRGGWVFAQGKGPLDDPKSELHRRDQMSQFDRKGYFSVDTGKFSLAPWLASQLSKKVIEYLGGF